MLEQCSAVVTAAASAAEGLAAFMREQVLAAGFDAFVPKPIDPETLCVELRRVLARDRLEA